MAVPLEDSPRLFVGGLKRAVEKWELEAVFAPYGDVSDVWVALDPPGYAFVEMAEVASAKVAMEALNNTPALGTTIRIERTKARDRSKTGRGRGRGDRGGRGDFRGRGRGRGGGYPRAGYTDEYGDDEDERPRLYVGDIQTDVEKPDIQKVFEKYGDVVDIWIARNPKGFAFVEYSELYDAKRAMKELNGANHFGSTLKIQITHNKRSSDRGGRGRGRGGDRGRGGGRGGDRGRGRGRGFARPPPEEVYGRPAKRGRSVAAHDPYYDTYEDPYVAGGYYEDPYYRDSYYEEPYAAYPPPPRRAADPYAARPARLLPPVDDPYAALPPAKAQDPYAADLYAEEPYAPYPPPRRDPYAARRARPVAADPYAVRPAPRRDPYADPHGELYAAAPAPRTTEEADPYTAVPARPAAVRDPYGESDPYARDPIPRDPRARDPRDPYATRPARPAADPYEEAATRPARPVAERDPYEEVATRPARPVAQRDPYEEVPTRPARLVAERDPYATRPARPAAERDPYATRPARPMAERDPYEEVPTRPVRQAAEPPRTERDPQAEKLARVIAERDLYKARASALERDSYAPRPAESRAEQYDPYNDLTDPAKPYDPIPFVAPARPAAERAAKQDPAPVKLSPRRPAPADTYDDQKRPVTAEQIAVRPPFRDT